MAATAREAPNFMGRVVGIYVHTVWGLIKQAILACLAVTATVLLFSCFPNATGCLLLLTVCLVVPIYIIAAVESAGWTDEEATGFAIFGSVLGLSPKTTRSAAAPWPKKRISTVS